MSADQWQHSLRVLYGTADRLEATAQVAPVPTPELPVVASAPDVEAPDRSVTRMLVSAAVHSALTVGVLLGGFALADPILPHAERPHLVDVAGADEAPGAGGAIPQSGAYRP